MEDGEAVPQAFGVGLRPLDPGRRHHRLDRRPSGRPVKAPKRRGMVAAEYTSTAWVL